jgi:hypothetical protein
MVAVSWRFCVVLLVGAAAGCSSSGAPAGQSTGTAGTGGTGGLGCVAGTPCLCFDGADGTTDCSFGPQGPAYCDCYQCPPFSPELPPPTSGCGGEPFGSWIAQTAEVTAGGDVVFYEGAVSIGSCSTQLLDFDPVVDMRLVLYDGGGASVSWSGVRVKRRFSEGCAINMTGDRCANIGCTSLTGCGLCECDDIVLGESGSFQWTRSAATLTLTEPSYPHRSRSLAYCVNGDSMTLEIPGVRFTMRRADFAGAPVACVARSLADCTKGTGCRIGECVGASATCATATTEPTCTNRQGCSWDTSRCLGTTPPLCTLAEYGVLPGCGIYQPGATCAGTALPCADIPAAQCTNLPGCSVRDACRGPALDCRQIADVLNVCDFDIGCSQNTSGACVGASSCEVQPTQLRCKSRYDCVWAVGACAGASGACASNSLTSCTRNPGCSIQGTPL